VAFNENEEPRELEIKANLPGLRVEGEPEEKSNAQTPQEIEKPLNPIPTTIPTQEIPSSVEPINSPALRPHRTRTEHDYRCLNNPQARPTDHTLDDATPPDITRQTESSAAKIISKNRKVFTLPGLIHVESMESMLAEASANLLFHGHHGFHME
jgi:hypothetical protein